MSTQMIFRLDDKTKTKLTKLAKSEGKTNSQVLRELIEDYIQERDIESYIDDLWNRTGKKLKAKGAKVIDIQKAIKKVRASKK